MKIRFNDFVNGIVSLVISQILIKIFGVIYSIYLTNKTGFGDEGNAIYMSGYQIYALLLTVSSIGVPNAISRLIAEKNGKKDIINRERIFLIAVYLFAIVGLMGTIFLYIFSDIFANKFLEISEATLSLKVLSPAIFCVSVSSVVKGFFNGINRIKVTAKVQFIEQVLKSLLTIILVECASKYSNNNIEIMAASANLATTFATIFSMIYIFKEYLKVTNIYEDKICFTRERIIHIIRNILIISMPMTLNAILSSLGKNIDSITIVKILKKIIGEEEAIKKYGIISSKIDILVSMPLSFNASIATSLIPEITKLKAKNDINELVRKIKFSFLMTIIISVPYCFGIYSYSNDILNILFPNASEGGILLQMSAFGIIFSMLTQTINAILQALGNNRIPVFASIIGIVFKLFSNIYLIPIEGIYEKGAIIGNILSSIISFSIVYYSLKNIINLDFKLTKLFFNPILGSLIMIIFSLFIKEKFLKIYINGRLLGLISVVISAIIYVFLMFFMKILNKEEILKSADNSGFATLENGKHLKNKKKFEKK